MTGGRAPNPRRVRIFLAEKGISVPLDAYRHGCDAASQRRGRFSRNPGFARLPVIELDDFGTVLCESVAIRRYFEELQPEPALFGRGPPGKATVEMWQRRIEFNPSSCGQLQAFRHIPSG